jgi:hypothetical protein
MRQRGRPAQDQPAATSAQLQTPGSPGYVPPSVDDDDAWHFLSLSYLWFPGMHGTVGARGYDTSVHVSAADVLKNFNIGIMGKIVKVKAN